MGKPSAKPMNNCVLFGFDGNTMMNWDPKMGHEWDILYKL